MINGNIENVHVAQDNAGKMAWERRDNQRYFYRSVRVGGKVKKIYYGKGPLAVAAAEAMEVARLERERRKEAIRLQREQYLLADTALANLTGELDRLLDAELMVVKT